MSFCSQLLHGLTLCCCLHLITQADPLQCYACNIQGQRDVDIGCYSPEVITCSHFHRGFKQRFCIKTESMASGMVLTSGCATSRHCHTEELPGVKIHCCDSDLCNCAPQHYKAWLSFYTLHIMTCYATMWL